MKKRFVILSLICGISAFAQNDSAKTWSFRADANLYFFSDDFIALPVFVADKEHLHLEARYNYEDLQTFSAWAGYNFYGGEKLEYFVTPMLGAVVGLSNGIALGLEFDLTLGDFNLYSESEYLFDFKSAENNFFYSWTDLSYAPKDWLWFGLSGQRTRLYQTETEIQHGIFMGTGFKGFEASVYVYNPEMDDPFFLLALSYNF